MIETEKKELTLLVVGVCNLHQIKHFLTQITQVKLEPGKLLFYP